VYEASRFQSDALSSEEVEQGLSNSPLLIYEQEVKEEVRYVYCCEADSERLLATSGVGPCPAHRRVARRGEKVRVVTAYDLDTGQKRDYLARRVRGE